MSSRKLRDLIQVLVPRGSTAERAVKSGIWVTLLNLFDRVLQLAKLVVLARLLEPADFGLMGIALLTLAGFKRFARLGIDTALIQRDARDVDEYLDTAWSMKLFRGVAIAVVAFVLAPHVARFFGEPRAADVIRVIALSPLIVGLGNPGVMYLRKNLEFHKQFVYTLSGTVAGVAVAIGTAVVLRNVWALVYGSLAGSLVTLVVSYLLHGYRPRPTFRYDIATELFGYGKWILGSGIVLFFIEQGDDAFVGWLLGASALGFYQLAYRFSNAPATEVTQVISRVVFPTYSQIQSEPEKLREAYYTTVQLTTVLSFPMAAGIVVVAPTFVRGFLGDQWLPAVPAIQILALWGGLLSLGATAGPLFRAVGRPDYGTKINAGKLVVIALLIYPLTARYGFAGTGFAVVGGALFFSEPLASYVAVRTVDGSYRTFAELLAYPFLGSSIMGVGVWIVRGIVDPSAPVLEFVILVCTGGALYVSTMLSIDELSGYDLRMSVRSMIDAVT